MLARLLGRTCHVTTLYTVVGQRSSSKLCCLRNNTTLSAKKFPSGQLNVLKRWITNWSNVTPKKVDKLRLIDEVPKQFMLIYEAPFCNYVAVALPFISAVLAFTGAALFKTAYNIWLTGVIPTGPFQEESYFRPETQLDYVLAFVFLMVLAYGLYSVVGRYPIRIYRFNDRFIAVFYRLIPFSKRKSHFGATVRKVEKRFGYPFIEYLYTTGSEDVILFPSHFRVPQDLNVMSGHTVKHYEL